MNQLDGTPLRIRGPGKPQFVRDGINGLSEFIGQLDSFARVVETSLKRPQAVHTEPGQHLSGILRNDQIAPWLEYRALWKRVGNRVLKRPCAHIHGFGPSIEQLHKLNLLRIQFRIIVNLIDHHIRGLGCNAPT